MEMHNIFYSTVVLNLVLIAKSEVNVIHIFSKRVIETFLDRPADFGGSIQDKTIEGYLKHIQPLSNGSCHDYGPAPPWVDGSTVWVALMERRGCEFVNMVLAAQKMHYNAVIVYNNKSMGNTLVSMTAYGVSGNKGSEVNIPSVFVGYDSGITLRTYDMKNNSRFFVQIKEETVKTSSFALYGHFLFFIPALIIIFCCIAKHKLYGPRRRILADNSGRFNPVNSPRSANFFANRIQRNKSKENQIRKAKFTEGHRYDTCPVCLDDFVEKDKLWILPCDHEFHVDCIKPWLTQKQNSCPVCKRMSISLTIKNV